MSSDRQRNLAVASPSHPAEPTASPFAHPSTTPRPTAAPVLQLFGPPLAGRVLIRDAGLAYVDLATGQRSDGMGATGYVDRVLALPDEWFVCVCVRQRTVGEERLRT